LPWQRERLELSDGDFLDLDWLGSKLRKVAILSHGLEGSSRRSYMEGMASRLVADGWDILSWNFRGCSGEPNRLPRAYHSGATDDLDSVVQHACLSRGYSCVVLIAFSLGANLTLKYLGERGAGCAPVAAGVAISVPCDLRSSAERMAQPDRRFYMKRFLREMGRRMDEKRARFGPQFPWTDWRSMTTFKEFDDAFTAPIHGFIDALDYWQQCSAKRFLGGIRVPTLILNAIDDPFLSPECHPYDFARESQYVFLDTPEKGGHVGFVNGSGWLGGYWAEERTAEFLSRFGG
jgi:uncharacterized protein